MKKALITGAAGFVGSHLIDHLVSKHIEICGIVHPSHPGKVLDTGQGKIKVEKCDLLKIDDLKKILKSNKFDYVFHLAAFSSPSQSFINPAQTLENNIIGQINLFEVLKSSISKSAKILVIGSSDEYGDVDEKSLPVDENTPLAPNSPYAVSKVAQDLLGLQYYLQNSLKIVRVRPFNHIGPGQSKSFVVSAFASQIAKLEKEGGGTMLVGNLESWKDFTDVRDIAKAYLLALEKGDSGDVYNIGSGNAYKIADILNELISYARVKLKVKKDPKLFRDGENKKICCDYSKFHRRTGWKPQIPISKTLFDTIGYERKHLN